MYVYIYIYIGELESEVIFILISSAIVWAATPTDGAPDR